MTDTEWFGHQCERHGIAVSDQGAAKAEFIRLMAGWTQCGNIEVTTQELEALRARAFANVRWALFGI